MDRKSFLNTLVSPAVKKTAAREPVTTNLVRRVPGLPSNLTSSINPYSGTWGDSQIIHLLKRLSFGAVKEDVDYFRTLTFSQAVDEMLLTKNANPGFPLKNYTPDVTTTPTNDPDWAVPIGRTWVNIPSSNGSVNSGRIGSVKAWWMDLQVNQGRSIEEKMILFLSTFTALEFDTVSYGTYCYRYLNTLRTYATGNYKSLVKAITLEPAMLIYLNGQYNTKTAPDENYGRELQELFTVGKGPGSQYTETDVQTAAKVLTGYRINSLGQTYFDTNNRHDTTNKTFSAFYNNTVIAGQTGINGQLELDNMLAMIFATDESAKFICRRIYRFFVYGDISADVETNVITPMASTLRNGNYELLPALSVLFKSEHFFDVLTQGAMIKSPLDFIVGLVRETKMKFPPATNIPTLYRMYNYLISQSASMDQNPGDVQNVSGWPAYYLNPVYDEFWLNTDTYGKRVSHITSMINGYSNTNQIIRVDWIAFTKRMTNPADPNILVQDFDTYLLRMQLEPATLTTIKTQTLLTGQSTDSYWTTAWNNYAGNPNNQTYFSDVNNRLSLLMKYFLNLEEFQLM
ncbi:MAG: DUF1800 family protein [Ferruginibacter sp.]